MKSQEYASATCKSYDNKSTKNSSSSTVASRRAIIVLISTMILDLLAFTCILPLFPAILDFYSSHGHRDWLYEKFVSVTVNFQEAVGVKDADQFYFVFLGGFLGSMFSALQFLSSPFLGALSDVYGRKPLLIFSVIGSLISYVIWSKATTFSLFFLSRFVGGLSKASVSLSTAIISDLYPPNAVGQGMALIGIAFSVSFIVGPMLGAYFAQAAKANNIDNQQLILTAPANFAILITVLELLIIIVFMKESLPKGDQKTKPGKVLRNILVYFKLNNLFGFTAIKGNISKKELQELQTHGKAYFTYLFLYSGLEFTLSFLTRVRFSYNSMQQGKMFLFIGLIMVLTQGLLVRRIPSSKHTKCANLGVTVLIPAFMIIALSNSVWTFYSGLLLYAISSGIVVPCLTSCASNLSSPELKGATLGVFRSLGALARAIGPIASSAVFWLGGPKICYILGGALLILPVIFLRGLRPRDSVTKDK